MTPPAMAGWNLALRFGLEVAALAGLALGGWRAGSGITRWPLMLILPIAAAAAWTVFNVPGDPSRSGEAPVVVNGSSRLFLELGILAAGTVGLATSSGLLALAVAALIIGHYAASWSRVGWLLDQS